MQESLCFSLRRSGIRARVTKQRRLRRHSFCFESLERRELLAGDLIAHWRADSLDATLDDGADVSEWTDLVGNAVGHGVGTPSLAQHAIGGRSAVRFDPSDGNDGVLVHRVANPLIGAADFSVAVVFATSSAELVGANGEWYENTGLVDSNELGISQDWGLTINQSGQLSGGLGAGFLRPKTTVYSTVSGLNDNQTHSAVFARQGSTLTLFVDGQAAGSRTDADTAPRNDDATFMVGMLNSNSNGFAGDIAEVRLFDGALDAQEAGDLHRQVMAYYNNVPPTAADDQYTLQEDPLLFFTTAANGVLANDSDPDGDALTAILETDVQNGALTFRQDGSFVYVPEKNFSGTDSFTYVSKDFRKSNIATVTLDVEPEYDPVTAKADSYKSLAGQELVVEAAAGLLANDDNPDAAQLSAVLKDDVSAGELTLNDDGSFRYDPRGFAGTMTFTYQVDDGTQLSTAQSVALVINTPPEVRDDSYRVDEDRVLVRSADNGVLRNDIDAESDQLFATIVDLPSHGAIELQADGSFEYVPSRDYFGADSFTYGISDGIDTSPTMATVSIDVRSLNDPPDTLPDTFFGLQDEIMVVAGSHGVLRNDSDIDSIAALTAVLEDRPTHGTLNFSNDGGFEYRPNAGFTGTDTFTYRASDGSDLSEPNTVTIAINSLGQQRQIVISEIHSNPDVDNELVEFVELFNRGQAPVDLSGWRFTDGVDLVFADGSSIMPGGHFLAAQDPVSLRAKFDVESAGPWVGRLASEGEKLELRSASGALIDEVNYGLGFPWPTVGDAPGASMQLVNVAIDNNLGGAWRSAAPSPLAANLTHADNPAPQVRQVSHDPRSPASGQPVMVTIKATDPDGVASVQLDYQLVDPGSYIRLTDDAYQTSWMSVAMTDDGQNGDATAGDGFYTTILSGDLQTNRRLVRYRIHATDSLGATVTGPYDDDPQPNFAYYVYDGVPDWTGSMRPGREPDETYSAESLTNVAVYQLLADEQDVNNSQYVSRFNQRQFRATFVYDGIVYDHIEFRNRGNASTYQVGKNKWKLNFTRGHGFRARDDYGNLYQQTWDKMNVLPGSNPWWRNDVSTEGTVLFEPVSFRLYELAGTPSSHTQYFHFRVVDSAEEASPTNQYSGDFWGLYMGIEQPDGSFLDERGLPDGNIFNVHGSAGGSSIRNQGSLLPSDKSDLSDFIRNNARPNDLEWWQENLHFESYFGFNAINLLVNNSDLRPNENVNYYHNQETGQWYTIPWDLDLTFEDRPHWSKPISAWESIQRVLGRYPSINAEYESRVREIFDLLLDNGDAANVVDEYVRILVPNDGSENIVEANQALWDYHPRKVKKGIWYRQFTSSLLPERSFNGVADYMQNFMDDGGFGYDQLKDRLDDSLIPDRPTINYLGADGFPVSDLRFQASAFADPKGADAFAAIQWRLAEIHNPAVPGYDPSRPFVYEIEGTWDSGPLEARELTIAMPGSGLETGKTYRARVRMQNSDGAWSHWSDPIEFQATAGVSSLSDTLRISEVHYHPADPSKAELAAGHLDSDDFEFLELVNIGSETIDLSDGELIKIDINGGEEGVVFAFASGAIRQLEPGARVLVVEDLAAFEFRYGSDLPVAGQWSGQLSNGGETVTLAALGNTIQQFAYDDNWHASTDGDGPSLEIIDATNADLATWNSAASWRPSSQSGGSPGTASSVSIAGDSNRDGVFNSSDLIQIFAAGEYDDDIAGNSTWEEGDWNGDGDFDSGDLIFACTAGTYVSAVVAAPANGIAAAIAFPGTRALRERERAEHALALSVVTLPERSDRKEIQLERLTDRVFADELDDFESGDQDRQQDSTNELNAWQEIAPID